MPKHIALLRGINVGGTKLIMAELRLLALDLGWRDPETYIQSGNLLFGATADPSVLEAALEEGIYRRFGLTIAVIVRSAQEWPGYIVGNPFPEAAAAEPNRLMLLLSKKAPAQAAAAAIRERARDGEQVEAAAGALWIHYPAGAGTSKLSPSLIDRLAGSPTTARNWRTVVKIGEMLGA